MKRSQINAAIDRARCALKAQNISLPCFADFTPGDFRRKKEDCQTISAVMLGWDVTDFGSGDFDHIGCVLFTVRNGSAEDPAIGVPYAEKYMVFCDSPSQEIPMHFHYQKQEDIINRAGGLMCIQVYNAAPDGSLDQTSDVTVYTDGIRNVVPAGTVLEITAGNSVTLTPGLYHRIFVKEGSGLLIAGEVSSVNDDHTDNHFLTPTNRFCGIEEDADKRYLLVGEYAEL